MFKPALDIWIAAPGDPQNVESVSYFLFNQYGKESRLAGLDCAAH